MALEAKEGLALLNGTQLMAAIGALAHQARDDFRRADELIALTGALACRPLLERARAAFSDARAV